MSLAAVFGAGGLPSRAPSPFTLAWMALRHYRLRSWVAGVALAAAVSTIHIHIALTLRPGERAAALIEGFEARTLVVMDSLVTTLDPALFTDAAAPLRDAGVEAVQGLRCASFFIGNDPAPLMVCGADLAALPTEFAALYPRLTGRNPSGNEVLLEATLANRLGAQASAPLSLFRRQPPLTVVGTFARTGQAPGPDALVPLATLQSLKQSEGWSLALLSLRAGLAPAAAQPPVQALLPDARVLTAADAAQGLRHGMAPLRLAAIALSATIAALCALTAMLALVSTVQERQADFAVLRVIGHARRRLVAQLLWEGLLLGLWGSFKGVLIGESLLWAMGGRIHPALATQSTLAEMSLPVAVGLASALIGALLPAWRACTVEPQGLLRP